MNVAELYQDVERQESAEVSFGIGWLDSPALEHEPCRLAYMVETGELFTVGRSGAAEIIGQFPIETCGVCHGEGCFSCVETGKSRYWVEQTLQGWEAQVDQPFGLRWVRRRVARFRFQP